MPAVRSLFESLVLSFVLEDPAGVFPTGDERGESAAGATSLPCREMVTAALARGAARARSRKMIPAFGFLMGWI
jgi:hypothetical protein